MSGLPDRKYFNIAQLTERWRKMYGECSQDYVLHYVETHSLTPAFRFKAVRCRTLAGSDEEGWKDVEQRIIPGVAESPYYCYSGLFSLTPMMGLSFWQKNYPLSEEWESDLRGLAFCCREGQIIPLQSFKVTPADFLFLLAEVLRFEAEHPPTQNAASPPPRQMTENEKPADYAERRKKEGATVGQIARELREQRAYYSTIGRTLEPEPPVEDSAYHKRGKKLVEMTD